MISIIIPTRNAEALLGDTLTALIPAVVEGIVREVIIVDGGSTDHTLQIADAFGATVIQAEAGRGPQLIAGALIARGPWLMFLHGDTVLEPGWERDVTHFMEQVDRGRIPPKAAALRFSLDDVGVMPRVVEAGVRLRCAFFKLPYGDQGLLLQQSLYRSIGGYRPMPMMEDVDIVRRLGAKRLVMLRALAITSAVRYRHDGYVLRIARNLSCLALYLMHMPVRLIVRLYG